MRRSDDRRHFCHAVPLHRSEEVVGEGLLLSSSFLLSQCRHAQLLVCGDAYDLCCFRERDYPVLWPKAL